MAWQDGWGFVHSRNRVWNPATLAWEPEVQASTGEGAAASTIVTISTGSVTTVPQTASTTARAGITQSSTSVTLQAANTARLHWSVFNRPTQNAQLYLKYGATASTADFDVQMAPDAYFELPMRYTGRIDGIWDSTGAGVARVTEFLA